MAMSPPSSLVPTSSTMKLSKISGKISHYKKTRELANFFFTDHDRSIMGLAAIAGALAGAAGMAASTARDAANLREEADYVEMKVDGKSAKGWVWFSPFQAGDEVEVIGTQQEGYFEIVAILRPTDRMIALYPHCSRGKKAHIKNIIKWWALSVSFMLLLLFPAFIFIVNIFTNYDLIKLFFGLDYIYTCIFFYTLFGLYFFVTGKRFMMFVNAATQVFKTMGLPDPDNIDLPKKTKRKPGDPGAFGVMYFNY
ncbi:putative type VI secretion system effector [Chromobacterium rhizoryzae]|uniref:putative type VI secretion system effector n=1 Tax=Chromobacterium rhizoryzae TaxID=1778675 RepID=UPI001D083959|nr:putative type VI secretion system effector [Chromobacterium rhizoryzae]